MMNLGKRTLKNIVMRAPLGLLDEVSKWTNYRQGYGFHEGGAKYEAELVSKILGNRARGAVVFDVGASSGEWSESFSRLQPECRVVAFEPNSTAFATLEKNLCGRELITTVQAAVDSSSGRRNLFFPEPGSMLSSLTQRKLIESKHRFENFEEVEVTSLDDFASAHSLYPIAVKIDVEGHELGVLEGASTIARECEIFQFEFGGTMIDTRVFFRDFWRFFRELNFQIYRITPGGLAHVPNYRERDEVFTFSNFIAVAERNETNLRACLQLQQGTRGSGFLPA